MKRSTLFIALFLFSLLFLLVLPTLAQDAGATPTADNIITVITPPATDGSTVVNSNNPFAPSDPYQLPIPAADEIANKGLQSLAAMFSGLLVFIASTPLVSLLKVYIPPFNMKNKDGEYRFSADQINLFVAIVISLATWGATLIGYGKQINAAWDILFRILPVFAAATGIYIGNQVGFSMASKVRMPIVGTSRTKATSYSPLEVRLQGEVDSLREALKAAPREIPKSFTDASRV